VETPPRSAQPDLHRNARAVTEAAAALGLAIEVREFPDGTRTAADAARAIGVSVGQIVKSLVFRVDGETVIALVSGPNRLDEPRLAAAVAEAGDGAAANRGAGDGTPTAAGATVGRADADAVRAATGFPIGGVPPFGHPRPLATFVDEDLLAFDALWAAAGTPRHVFALSPDDLVRATGGHVAALRAG
jgi:prolyl-tRNA editing enzyme YbaK/EbsC (Cys-tRNA(Pro) deacylase)